MQEILIKAIKSLVTVKSIVTLVLVAVFAVLSLKGKVASDDFLMIFFSVIGFYFGTQNEKKNHNA